MCTSGGIASILSDSLQHIIIESGTPYPSRDGDVYNSIVSSCMYMLDGNSTYLSVSTASERNILGSCFYF